MARILVAALYKFAALPDHAALRAPLLAVCKDNDVKGTLLLADEGINGTIAGPEPGLRTVLAHLREDWRFADLEHKESWAQANPFKRMKVRLKQEIVTLGAPEADPTRQVGDYVEAEDWNALIADPDVLVIDTRNDYEVAIGTFEAAVDPKIGSFREFPDWFAGQADLSGKSKIAMFCTGGIRCEKSTALLKARGFDEVYHLRGGILKYLETVPQAESLWRGQCFVFDERVSVGHGLEPGPYELCYACRRPVSEAERASPAYVKGVSCPACRDELSDEKRERLVERQRQVELADARGEAHVGADLATQKMRKLERR